MIFAALRTFNAEFGNPVMVGWIVTAFLLAAAASASVCSRFGDMFGRRRMLLGVLAVAGTGSLVSALATSIGGVIAGRAIQGVAGAVLPLCFGLVREKLPAARAPFGIGVVSAAAFVSGGAAIFLGGVLIDHLSWHAIFYVGQRPRSSRRWPCGSACLLRRVLLRPSLSTCRARCCWCRRSPAC